MSGDGNNGALVGAEDLVKGDLGAVILRRACLGRDAVPELVVFGEGALELPGREQVVDVRLVAAVVAGVRADALAEELFDRRQEWARLWQRQVAVGVVCGLKAARQRRGVVGLWRLDALVFDQRGPEDVVRNGLLDACWVEGCIGPGYGGVAVDLRVVAVPGWSSVIGLRSVVPALAVAANEEEFVHDVFGGVEVEVVDVVVEALPLGQARDVDTGLAWVGLVDETEVGGKLSSISARSDLLGLVHT